MSGFAMVLTIDQAGATTAFAALRQVNDDFRPVLADIGAELESSTVERFETNIAPDGTPWPQSAAAVERGGPTLVEHGYLRDSVAYRLDGNDAVEVGEGGIASAYAWIHQAGFDETVTVQAHERSFTMVFGKPFSGVATVKAHERHMTMPARPSIGLSAADREAVPNIVVDHWRRAIVKGIG